MLNSLGPSTDPWGTPHVMCECVFMLWSTFYLFSHIYVLKLFRNNFRLSSFYLSIFHFLLIQKNDPNLDFCDPLHPWCKKKLRIFLPYLVFRALLVPTGSKGTRWLYRLMSFMHSSHLSEETLSVSLDERMQNLNG